MDADKPGNNMAAVVNRKKAEKLRKLKMIQRKELLKRVQVHLEKIPRPHWNSSAVWPYRYRDMDIESIPPLSKMFKQTSYWGKNCNPKPKVPPKNKRFHPLGSAVAFPISPRRPNNKRLSSAATPSPRQLKQALKENNIRAGSSLTVTRHHVVITKKEIDNIWKPPPKPTNHTVKMQVVPQVDSVNLNNPQHRIEQFDLNYSQKSPLYKKHVRSVQNQTPVAYPKIDYDVDEKNKFPNFYKKN